MVKLQKRSKSNVKSKKKNVIRFEINYDNLGNLDYIRNALTCYGSFDHVLNVCITLTYKLCSILVFVNGGLDALKNCVGKPKG